MLACEPSNQLQAEGSFWNHGHSNGADTKCPLVSLKEEIAKERPSPCTSFSSCGMLARTRWLTNHQILFQASMVMRPTRRRAIHVSVDQIQLHRLRRTKTPKSTNGAVQLIFSSSRLPKEKPATVRYMYQPTPMDVPEEAQRSRMRRWSARHPTKGSRSNHRRRKRVAETKVLPDLMSTTIILQSLIP